MIALTENFKAAMRKQAVHPLVLVTITLDGSEVKFLSGPSSKIDYPPLLSTCTPVNPKINIKERTAQSSLLTLEFVESTRLRDIIKNNYMRNKAVSVRLGERDLDEADYAPFFSGVVGEIITDPGAITIECADALEYAKGKKSKRQIYNKHPLDVILDLLDEAEIPSGFIDLDAFDTANYPDISHYCLTEQNPTDASEGLNEERKERMPSKDLWSTIEDIASTLFGSVYLDERGKITFTRYDKNKNVVATINGDDVSDFEHIGYLSDLTNNVRVSTGSSESDSSVTAKDADSQQNHKYPGLQEFVAGLDINWPIYGHAAELGVLTTSPTDYIDRLNMERPPGYVLTPSANAVGTWSHHIVKTADTDANVDLTLAGHSVDGFCGTAVEKEWSNGASSITSHEPSKKLSSERPLYFKIHKEIIKATAGYVPFSHHTRRRITEIGSTYIPMFDSWSYEYETIPGKMVITDFERGVFGTHSATHRGRNKENPERALAVDVTVAMDYASKLVERFANGVHEIRLRTDLTYYDIQVGEFVAYGTSFMADHQSVNASKWEVISKEVDVIGDSPGIAWTLAQVPTESITLYGGLLVDVVNEVYGDNIGLIKNDFTQTLHVKSGFDLTASGDGTQVLIDPGTLGIYGSSLQVNTNWAITPEQDKDTYIYADSVSGQIEVVSASAGEIPLSQPSSYIELARVSADSSGAITAIEDLRQTKAYTGSVIAGGEGPLANLDPSGNFVGTVEASQVLNLPELGNVNALDIRLTAVESDYATSGDIPDVSNFITSADLPDHSQFATTTALAAVSTIADGAIQSGQEQITIKDFHQKTSGLDDGLIRNPSFHQYNENDVPTHWYTWNCDPANDPLDNSNQWLAKGHSARGFNSVMIQGDRFPDGSVPQTPVLISEGANIGYGDHLKLEIVFGAITPDTINASWGVTVYYHYCLPDGSIYYTGANTGMNHTSDQFISGGSTLGGGLHPRLFSFKIPPNGDQFWIDKAAEAAAGSWPDAPNYIGLPIEARFSFRQTNLVNDKYGFKVCYFNAHRVGNNVKDWDDSTVQYVADINTTAINAQTTADGAIQNGTGVINNAQLGDYIVSATKLTTSCADRLLPNGETGSGVISNLSNVSLVANEALAASTHGLVSNPDFRLTNANGSPQTWNFWSSSFGATFDYDDESFYGQKSIHVTGMSSGSYPVAASYRFPVYHGQRLKCRAIIKPTFAGSRMWGHVYFYRILPDGTEDYTGRAHVWHNADAASDDWQIIENSFAVPAADDSWWTTVSDPAPTDQPLVARITWRQPYGWPNNSSTMPDGSSGYGSASGDYDWRISYMNCFHVGFNSKDFDSETRDKFDSFLPQSEVFHYAVGSMNNTDIQILVPNGWNGNTGTFPLAAMP